MNAHRALLIAALLTTVGACSKPTTTGNRAGSTATPRFNQNACLDPIAGARYRICGRLSTAALASPQGDRWVGGTINASQEDVNGDKYRLVGGTFHADR